MSRLNAAGSVATTISGQRGNDGDSILRSNSPRLQFAGILDCTRQARNGNNILDSSRLIW